jgi:hypothetical protein
MSTKEKSNVADTVDATVIAGKGLREGAGASGVYTVVCIGADGAEKWRDEFPNLVVNSGLQLMNNTFFAGTSYTAVWYLGLITGPGSGTTFNATDTMLSHVGWTENTGYSNANRPTVTFGTATLADPSVIATTATSFSINAAGTIAGAFLTTNNTKGGTTGTLFSASDFTGGDRILASGDTLNVTYTFTLEAP